MQNERTYRQLHPRVIDAKAPSRIAWVFVGILWIWFVLLMAFLVLFVGYHW